MVRRWVSSPAGMAGAVAFVLAALALALRWRGADWPAQLYRVDLFERVGFTQWSNQWYGGHHTPGYSMLFPPLAAVLGIGTVALGSAVAAAWTFGMLAARYLPSARLAAAVFAAGTVTNLAVGRLTFALGLALGIAAVLAMTVERRWLAVGLAMLTALSSPVAGVFVLLVGVAWGRRLGVAVAVAGVAPIALLAVTFPEGGVFPFSVEDAVLMAAVGLAAVVLAPPKYRTLRAGGALYALGVAATFAVPNALGANVTRLGIFVGPAVAIGLLWPARRLAASMVAVPLLVWQWAPAFDGIFTAGRDPSSVSSYYDGLLAELRRLPPTRIEIPFTKRHWEATYVAPHAALARGWERQLDIGLNPLFYDDAVPLTVEAYRAWLRDNAVGYVALSDAELDSSAVTEAALLRAGVPGLNEVWRDDHWQLFAVTFARPLVEGDAELTRLDADSFTVRVDAPGDVLVRIRYSSHWDIEGPGCVVPSADGWTRIRFPAVGTWRVRQVVSRWIPFRPDRIDECPVVAG